jgi:hypothetical protein
VAVVGVVVVGVEEDMVTDEGKVDGKEMYPCREVESDGDHSEFTLLVPNFDVVLVGPSYVSRRWVRGSLEVVVAGRLEVGAEDGLGVMDRRA